MQLFSTAKLYHHPDRLLAYINNGLVYPVTVEIHLTNRCNIKCNYCCFKGRQDNTEMDYYEAVSVLNKLDSMNVKAVAFSGGGEPTVHPQIFEVVQYANELGFDVGLITNGVKFDVRLLDYLTWVRFSLDTANADTYKKIKGADKFANVISNIRMAVEYKQKLQLNTTIGIHAVITQDNIGELEDIAKLSDSLGADYFQYRPLERDNTVDKPDKPQGLDINIMDTAYKWEELKDTTPYTGCLGADFIGAVGVDCNFYMCSVHAYDKTASYGNVLTDDIFKNRAAVQELFDYTKCPKACRGAVINNILAGYNKIDHVNFL